MQIMAILNVTPDSFSDGGRFNSLTSSMQQVDLLVEEGADIIDIGGESTRPFAEPVGVEDELERVIPVIKAIRQNYPDLLISIDTTKARVAHQAIDAGANIVNDISALTHDPEMPRLACETDTPIIIMHMQGTPGNMQDDPQYGDVIGDISAFFTKRLNWLEEKGIDRKRITIDPGIGFGKTVEHNLSILKHLEAFHHLGQPVLLGHSRKRFIGDITGLDVSERDLATAIVSAIGVMKKVSILRVHDVKATRQAIQMVQAIENAD